MTMDEAGVVFRREFVCDSNNLAFVYFTIHIEKQLCMHTGIVHAAGVREVIDGKIRQACMK